MRPSSKPANCYFRLRTPLLDSWKFSKRRAYFLAHLLLIQAPSPSGFSFPNPFASNPFDQAKDAAQSADRSAKDTAKDLAQGASLNKAKNVAKDADQSAKSAFGLPSNPLAGLGDKIQGSAQQAKGDVSDAVSNLTGSNPVAGGKNILGQAVDKAQGNAEQVRIVVWASLHCVVEEELSKNNRSAFWNAYILVFDYRVGLPGTRQNDGQ
jgi:hypothetical protein